MRPLIDLIRDGGENVIVRGMPTIELRHVTIVIEDPADCLMTNVGRNMNLRLAALEALQLISGQQYPELARKVAPNMAQFMDGGSFHGAYGPRLRYQLQKIAQMLVDDPTTRQAVATVWDPSYDGNGGTRDTPCTVYLSFMVRQDKLIMHTHMRSNDVWWGWTYDVAQFCSLQICMAAAVGRDVGEYVHYADSFHLYDRDLEAAVQIQSGYLGGRDLIKPLVCPWTEDFSPVPNWSSQVERAQQILDGVELNDLSSSFLERMGVKIHEQA